MNKMKNILTQLTNKFKGKALLTIIISMTFACSPDPLDIVQDYGEGATFCSFYSNNFDSFEQGDLAEFSLNVSAPGLQDLASVEFTDKDGKLTSIKPEDKTSCQILSNVEHKNFKGFHTYAIRTDNTKVSRYFRNGSFSEQRIYCSSQSDSIQGDLISCNADKAELDKMIVPQDLGPHEAALAPKLEIPNGFSSNNLSCFKRKNSPSSCSEESSFNQTKGKLTFHKKSGDYNLEGIEIYALKPYLFNQLVRYNQGSCSRVSQVSSFLSLLKTADARLKETAYWYTKTLDSEGSFVFSNLPKKEALIFVIDTRVNKALSASLVSGVFVDSDYQLELPLLTKNQRETIESQFNCSKTSLFNTRGLAIIEARSCTGERPFRMYLSSADQSCENQNFVPLLNTKLDVEKNINQASSVAGSYVFQTDVSGFRKISAWGANGEIDSFDLFTLSDAVSFHQLGLGNYLK